MNGNLAGKQGESAIFYGTLVRYFSWGNQAGRGVGESGAHEAPYVALLIQGIQRGMGESGGAGLLAAPLDVE